MSVDLKVPSLGESVREATIERWLHKEGDFVKRDEPLVALESDKANVEVPAPVGGILKAIVKQAGSKVAVGETLARIEPATMRLSRQNLAGAPLPTTPEAAAALAAVTTPAQGIPRASIAAASPTAAGTQPAAHPSTIAPPDVPRLHEAPVQDVSAEAHLPPSMRRALREHGLDPSQVKPASPDGRIVAADVQRAIDQRRAPAATAPAPRATPGRDGRKVERVPMTSLRKRIAERLVEGRKQAAILTTFNEVDMSRIMALREEHKERFQQKHGIKLGFMSFFVKAAIEGLKAFPELNARIDGNDIVYHHYYDVGVAVGGGKGLVVPVVRNAELLSFAEVEKTIDGLAKKARDNKLAPDDLAGGTFTISNGGVFGSLLSTPLLNPPQTGIIGMHSIQKRPIAVGDQVVVRPMMYVALSYDHRIVDGREAVQFLVRVKECIEAPDRILLEV